MDNVVDMTIYVNHFFRAIEHVYSHGIISDYVDLHDMYWLLDTEVSQLAGHFLTELTRVSCQAKRIRITNLSTSDFLVEFFYEF